MLRKLIVSSALAAALACGGLVEGAHAAQAPARPVAKISPYSPEGQAIVAQIKALDRSIRFQQRMSNERATRTNGADTERYFVLSSLYGFGSTYYGGAYSGYGRYADYYLPRSGFYVYSPPLSASSTLPERGTVKYRRLVRERAALQARLAAR